METPILLTLPFDIIFAIVINIGDRDFINLCRAHSKLSAHLRDEHLARKIVGTTMGYSKEGQRAAAGEKDYPYRKAIEHRFYINEAFATAQPYSVDILVYGSDFLYNQGFICYLIDHEIRLLGVHNMETRERVLNLDRLSRFHELESETARLAEKVSLLHFADNIVVFRITRDQGQDSMLLAVDMAFASAHAEDPVLFRGQVPESASLFVKHSRSYLWFGTCMDQQAWIIFGVDMARREPHAVELAQALYGDVGNSVSFMILQDHLYAVSTLPADEDEERSSSFYYWTCCTPHDQHFQGRLWRRENAGGPLNESWYDLSIRVNDRTGQPTILECRREWPDGNSENHRIYYRQPLPSLEMLTCDAPTRSSSVSPDGIDLDSITTNYPQRPACDVHPEFDPALSETKRKEFILAHTKHRAYHDASSTFVDLVLERQLATGNVRPEVHLHLRTISRVLQGPIGERAPLHERESSSPFAQDHFVSRGVQMWPFDHADTDLCNFLHPTRSMMPIRAISDERSLLYSTRYLGLPSGQVAFMLLSFDPSISFCNKRMKCSLTKCDDVFPVQVSQHASPVRSLVSQDVSFCERIGAGRWLR